MITTLGSQLIGVFGGTFDPIHNGHLEVARAVTRDFGLDRLLLIPAFVPPHKKRDAISSAYHRYAMAVLATLEDEILLVSSVELQAPEKPFTFETVERLKQLYDRQARLFFIMGADSFAEINTWREPARLLSQTNLIVVTRPGHPVSASHLPAGVTAQVIDLRRRDGQEPDEAAGGDCCDIFLTDLVNRDISSTDIRRRARAGESIREVVPPRVADYIDKYRLYRGD